MKKVLFILLLLPCIGFGQNILLPVDSETQKVSFVSIVDVNNVSQSELHNRAKVWFINSFRDSKEVIQLDDKENGILIGKGNSIITYSATLVTMTENISFKVVIRVKDNKYRAEITDIVLRSEPNQFQASAISTPVEMYNAEKPNKNKTIQKIIAAIIDKTETTMLSIKKDMAASPVALKDF